MVAGRVVRRRVRAVRGIDLGFFPLSPDPVSRGTRSHGGLSCDIIFDWS